MDEQTKIRFVKARAPKEIKERCGIEYLDFYLKFENFEWSSIIEPLSNIKIPKSGKNGYSFPFCRNLYMVNYTFDASAKDFYDYLNMDDENKEIIKRFFRNMEGINCFKQFEHEKLMEESTKPKTKEAIEEYELVLKIKKLLP